jgi:tight adherence protein C
VSGLLGGAAGALAGAGVAALLLDALGRARVRRPSLGSGLPLAIARAASRAGTRLAFAGRRRPLSAADAAERLAAAGREARFDPSEWTGLKCAGAAAAGLCVAVGAGSLPGRLPLVALVAAPAAGFARRLRAAGRQLAPMLDLLQVTVEAGASPAAALGAVGARFSGPLAEEWRAASAAIALGTPQDRALDTLARRLPSARIRAFTDCMSRARRRGVPLGDLLAQQAVAARHEEQLRIREQAARAGPKIQLVVAFVLVPSVMLIVAAALFTELTAPGVALTY